MKRTWTVSLIAAFAIFVTTVRAEPWMSDPIISDGWGPFLIYRNLVNMRIGSSPGAYGDWEIGLHTRQFGFIPVATERNYIWPNGADPNSWMGDNPDSEFTLTFTKETGTVDFTIGYAPTLSYDYEEYAEMGMDTLYLMARTKMPKYTCAITDLKLNGSGIENAGDLIISGTHMYATIGGIDCNDFTLTGNVVFSYTEGNPRHSKIEALIAFGRAGPGPVIIDGKIDEWKTAGSRYIYADGTLGGDQIGTGKLYTGYDDKNFYLAYNLENTGSRDDYILFFNGGIYFPDPNVFSTKNYGNSLFPQPTEFIRTDTTLELRQNWQSVRGEGAVYGEWFIQLISNKLRRIIRFGSIMDGNWWHGTGNVNNLAYYAGSYHGGEPFPGVYVNDDVDENGWILTGFDSSDPNFGHFYLSEPLHSDEVWTLVDRASIELKGPEYNPYVVELKSIGDEAPPWGSILFRPSEPMTFNDIEELSSDYNITEGTFGGGSPRFSILIDWNDSHVADPGDEYAFLYWGTPPDYTDIIPSGWQNTGNLYDSNDVRIDLTKFGGPFYATIGDAKALFGEKNVFEVILVLDGGWIDDQVMLVDNITIDDYTYDALPLPTEVDINCDINGDGEITMPDLSIMALNWLRQDCLVADCNSADIAPLVRDGVVDNVDFSAMNNCWQDGVIPDTISPDPNIMTWSSEPNAIAGANSITMTATTATDKSGVEYYFKNVTLPTHNSAWQPDPTYTDTELEPGTEYTYQVKARDMSPYKNETRYSVPASAVAEGSPEAIEVEDIFVPVPPHDARIWDDGFGTGEGFDRDDSDYKALRLGDYNTNQSYRILLGFDTSSLPTDAEIISARLQLTCGSKEGTSPFKGWGGTCAIDIASPYFGDSEDIEIADWNNSADAYNVAQFTTDPGAINPIISTDFNAEGLSQINTYGTTQLRVYFTIPRSINDRNDFVGFYSAEQEVYLDKRPQLIIRYKSRTPTMAIPGIAAHDGRVYDNGYGTGLGAIDNENSSKALRLGDYLSNQSYRSVVSFDTSVFPENYTIEGVMLKLASGAKSGSDPFTWGGTCAIDLGVPDFGTSKYLEAVDWQADATVAGVASFASAPADPNEGYYMVSSRFSPEGRMNINLNGLTQLRVYFTTPRNDNIDSDYLGFYSAEAVETRKPKLLIEYSID
ncbi:MAG TPA: hypothetical protein HPP87_08605 [Planctomycetes bacterium]|nr:hypothetical protein [Planctomycetota bacterium]